MFQRSVLANGLRVLSSTMPSTRSVSIGIFVGAGSRYENEPLAGASHYLEHMLFKGTERRPEPQMISSAIESVGGVLNAATDREMTIYYVKVGLPHFNMALDLLSDMVLNSAMVPHEVERERQVIIEELNMTNDQPDARVDLLIEQALWPDQPMGRDVGGSRETVSAISRDMLVDYWKTQYVPNNAVICVAGNITHDEVVDAVNKQLGNWKPGDPLDWYRVLPANGNPKIAWEHRKTDQAHLCLAFPGVSLMDPQRYPLDLLNNVLGEGMSSRLFMEVRERRGLAYAVQSGVDHYRDCGAVTVYCGVDPLKATDALSAILGELEKIGGTITNQELETAINFINGRLMLRLEDSRSVMNWGGAQELLYNRIRTPDEVIADLQQVKLEEVRAAARSYFSPEHYRLAVVGPFRSDARFRKMLA